MDSVTLPVFTCPCCYAESHNPMDVKHQYCGRCYWWTGDPVLGPPHLADLCEARTEALLRADQSAALDDDLG